MITKPNNYYFYPLYPHKPLGKQNSWIQISCEVLKKEQKIITSQLTLHLLKAAKHALKILITIYSFNDILN